MQLLKSLQRSKCFVERLGHLNEVAETAWVYVTKIEDGEDQFVYDLSVPGNHSYVANNIYSHNTVMTLADIAATIREVGAKNPIKPIVVCPDGLVRNWCEDMVKITGASWNMIPLTTEIYGRWGQDKLAEVLTDAPPNTIVVCSMSFLSKAQRIQ